MASKFSIICSGKQRSRSSIKITIRSRPVASINDLKLSRNSLTAENCSVFICVLKASFINSSASPPVIFSSNSFLLDSVLKEPKNEIRLGINEAPPVVYAIAAGAKTFFTDHRRVRIEKILFFTVLAAFFTVSFKSPVKHLLFSRFSTIPCINAIFASSKLSKLHPSKYITTEVSFESASFSIISFKILRVLDFPLPQSP